MTQLDHPYAPHGHGYPPAPLPENPGKASGIGAFIGSLLFWPAGLIVAIVSMSKSRRVGMPPTGLALAGLVISILWGAGTILLIGAAVATSGGSSPTAETPVVSSGEDSATDDAAAPADAADSYTCDDLTADAITAMPSDRNSLFLLAVQNAKATVDKRAQYRSGELSIPAGKNEAVVFRCQGEGMFDDGSERHVKLTATIDVNDEVWYQWEALES